MSMKTRDYVALEDRHEAHYYKPLDVVINRAEGVWVWDVEGNKYLDCLAAYSAVNQGHCHPVIARALAEQSAKVALVSRAFRNDQLGPFYQAVSELTGFPRVLPMNTGAEAVEAAVKLARKWAYTIKGVEDDQAEILVFSDNFHGRTTTIVGFSSEPQYKQGFGPFSAGFRILPYGDLEAVRQAIHPIVAAILIEPIQGEGGIIIPPEGYLRGLRDLATEHNLLLMLDEIQSGLGRTGKMFAYEHEGACPDVLILGKALSGGLYPVSVVCAADAVMDVFRPGDHGSTYGGNPVAAAVARAAIGVLQDEKLVDNSAELGGYLLGRLQELDSPYVEEVRGVGLWVGIELKPEAGGARQFCEALQELGILCKETHEHVIRFAPPLVISRAEIDWALERISEVLTSDRFLQATSQPVA
jgi:ornithine--oxo-acid transaminase